MYISLVIAFIMMAVCMGVLIEMHSTNKKNNITHNIIYDHNNIPYRVIPLDEE